VLTTMPSDEQETGVTHCHAIPSLPLCSSKNFGDREPIDSKAAGLNRSGDAIHAATDELSMVFHTDRLDHGGRPVSRLDFGSDRAGLHLQMRLSCKLLDGQFGDSHIAPGDRPDQRFEGPDLDGQEQRVEDGPDNARVLDQAQSGYMVVSLFCYAQTVS
jgi:hypothetical protein